MEYFINILLLIVGMVLLVKGADFFVGGASDIAKKLGIPSLISKNPLPEPPQFTKQEETNVLNNNVVKMAYLLAKYGNSKNDSYKLFLSAINSANSKGEMSAIFEIAKSTNQEELIGKLAKQLTYKDVYFVDNLYPLLGSR